MMTDKIEVTQADRIRAEVVCEAIFNQTRHACALAVERSRELIAQSGMLAVDPEMLRCIEQLIDGVQLKVCEVLLDKDWIEKPVQDFARHRQQALAQHEGGWGEPVAWMYELEGEIWLQTEREPSFDIFDREPTEIPLYTHPPATRPAALAEEVARLRKAVAEAKISLGAIGEPKPPHDPPDAKICGVIARSCLVRIRAALNEQSNGEKG